MSVDGSPETSNGNGNNFKKLLDTISGLQTDLQKTLTVCRNLRSENEELKGTLGSTRGDLNTVRKRYHELRENYVSVSSSKLESDRLYKQSIQRWRVDLAERANELEGWKLKYAPADLDLIKVKVHEELEITFKEEIANLKFQVEQKDAVNFEFASRLANLQGEFDNYVTGKDEECLGLSSLYEQETNNLSKLASDYRLQVESSSINDESEDSIRKLAGQLSEMSGKYDASESENRHLTVELTQVRQELHELQTNFTSQDMLARQQKSEYSIERQTLIESVNIRAIESRRLEERTKALCRELSESRSQLNNHDRWLDLKQEISNKNSEISRMNEMMMQYTLDLRNKDDLLQTQNANHNDKLNSMNDMIMEYKSETNRSIQNLTVELKKAIKKCALYKDKAILAHEHCKKLMASS